MPDEATMLAAYAASYPDETDRLILADWLEERGDVRGTWLRDPDLARIMGPNLDDPRPILVENLASDDPRAQRDALTALGNIGELAAEAMPALLGLLKDDREAIRHAALATLGQLGREADDALFYARHEVEGWGQVGHAAFHAVIVKRGPQSQAVRILVSHLGEWNEDVRGSAARSLIELGPDVLDVVLRRGADIAEEQEWSVSGVLRAFPDADARLLAVAQNPTRDQASRCCAIRALVCSFREGTPGSDREWLIPHLVELAGDTSQRVAVAAARGLGTYGERAASAVSALVQLLGIEDPDLRAEVIDALRELGPDASVALPTIRPLIGGGDSFRLDHAAQDFVRRHAAPADLAEEIRQGLRASEVLVRVAFLQRLGTMPGHFPDLVDLLQQAIDDPEPEMRHAVSIVLGSLRWPAEIKGEAFLRALLDHPDGAVRVAAIRATEYDHLLVELLPDLLDRLRSDPDASVRLHIVAVIAGPDDGYRVQVPQLDSPAVKDALRAALGDQSHSVRAAALKTLRDLCMQSLPQEVLPGLLELARTDHDEAGNAAIFDIHQGFGNPPGFLEILRERLLLYPAPVAYPVFYPLNYFGYVPTLDEMPVLLQAAQDANSNRSYGAVEMLGRLGDAVVPELIPLLSPSQPAHVRGWTAQVLGRLGPAARTALPALWDLLRVSDDEFDLGTALIAIAWLSEPAEVIEPLRPFFRHRKGRVRRTMTHITARLGLAVRSWLPDLLHLSRTDGDTEHALAALVRADPTLLEVVLTLLDDPEPARTAALEALFHLGPLANSAVPRLRSMLTEIEPNRRDIIERALQALGG